MHKWFPVFLSLALACGACSSVSISSDYDPDVDFSRGFASYAWLPDGELKDTGVADALTDKLLREAIDTEMAAKGFTRAGAAPDFFVGYHAAVEQKLATRPSSSAGFVVGSHGRVGTTFGVSSADEVYLYDQGTLVLDFLAADTKALVWRGTASRSVYPANTREERPPGRARPKQMSTLPADEVAQPPAIVQTYVAGAAMVERLSRLSATDPARSARRRSTQ